MAEETQSGVKPVASPASGVLNWGDAELRNKQTTFPAKLVRITQAMRKVEEIDEDGNPTATRFEVQPNRFLAIFATKDSKGVWHTKKPVSTFANHWPYGIIPQQPNLEVTVTMYENDEGYPTLMSVEYNADNLSDKNLRLIEMASKMKRGTADDLE